MSQGKQLLEYYQNKIDELYKQRLAWLSKFDQCGQLLKQKQYLMNQIKNHKDKQIDLQRGIVHHDVTLLDQKLNVVRMERQNINNQFIDAEEILKMEELIEEYPLQLEKHLPCKILTSGGPIIDNELNIHAASKKGKNNAANIFRQNNSVLISGKTADSKMKYKPSKQELIKRQIIQLKTNQEKQICLLNEQKNKLENLLKDVRQNQAKTLNNEREALDKLKKELKKQQQKHKELAQRYFETRKKLKEQHLDTKEQNQRLKATVNSLEQKVNVEMKVYEKENKAKQTLIIRKSQDFQEDYKARMRAKERNLQAMKDNYEKMQEVCIQKIKKIEEALTNSKYYLNQTERRRNIEIGQLKNQLSILEKQVYEERVEKARIDQIMRNKIEQEKRKRMIIQQREQQEKRKNEKAKLIPQAYKATTKSKAESKKHKSAKKLKKNKSEQSDYSQQESMALSDLENIRQQIHKLQNKLEDKGRKIK